MQAGRSSRCRFYSAACFSARAFIRSSWAVRCFSQRSREASSGIWRQRADGKWALYKPDGNPVSSQWGYVDGKTYLLDMYGIMQTGWQNVNGNWYYLNSKGAMQTGWLLKEGKYYFLNTDGTMAYGWVNSQGSWYYFQKPDGDMLTNAYAPDGRYVNAEGVLIQ